MCFTTCYLRVPKDSEGWAVVRLHTVLGLDLATPRTHRASPTLPFSHLTRHSSLLIQPFCPFDTAAFLPSLHLRTPPSEYDERRGTPALFKLRKERNDLNRTKGKDDRGKAQQRKHARTYKNVRRKAASAIDMDYARLLLLVCREKERDWQKDMRREGNTPKTLTIS